MISGTIRRIISDSERRRLETLLEENIIEGFAEIVDRTTEWISTPAARDFFFNRNRMLHQFFRESGIQDEWSNIIERRAIRGADIAEQIYDYARKVNAPEGLVEYTSRDRAVLNAICDNQYELVKNATEYEVQGIRRCILEDVTNGVNPKQTSLKEVQLTPVNGLSPEKRAEMIARTETATTLNTATLQQMKDEGVEMVELVGGGVNCCEDCEELLGVAMPIDEALDMPILHPNCTCTWREVRQPIDAPHPFEEEGWLNP
jgi:SPP1 gp7 family putative phage head morphogenesis protein